MPRKIIPTPVQTDVKSRPEATIRRTLAGLDELGLTEALPEARTLVARAETLNKVRASSDAELKRGRANLLERLVDGQVSLTDAAGELAALEQLARTEGSTVPKLAQQAAERAYQRAWRSICAAGDRLVSEHLSVDATVAEAVRLDAELPGHISNADDAVSYGADAAATWSRLAELRATWDLAHRIADDLRSAGALPVVNVGAYPSLPAYDPLAHRFTDPERSVGVHAPGPRWLAAVHAAGAEPTILTAEQVREIGTVPAA